MEEDPSVISHQRNWMGRAPVRLWTAAVVVEEERRWLAEKMRISLMAVVGMFLRRLQ